MSEEKSQAEKLQQAPTLRKYFDDRDILISYKTGKLAYFEKGKLVTEYERTHLGYQSMNEKLKQLQEEQPKRGRI